MSSAATLRLQIESALAHKIPSALSPAPKMFRPAAATGIEPLDELLLGGFPIGAVSELTGPESSGRTSIALSFIGRRTQERKVCAWVDVTNALDPVSAAAAGVDLNRLLWIRCGGTVEQRRRPAPAFVLPKKYLTPAPTKKGLHGGGFGPHPRTEARGLAEAIADLMPSADPVQRVQRPTHIPQQTPQPTPPAPRSSQPPSMSKPWSRMEQALRSTDLLLQAGGFSAIVLDMGSLAPEFVSRVPLATWHRYRLAAEKTRSSILLITQYACAKNSAELVLRLQTAEAIGDEQTVFTGLSPRVQIVCQRFTPTATNVLQLRKPPQRTDTAQWQSRTTWAGPR